MAVMFDRITKQSDLHSLRDSSCVVTVLFSQNVQLDSES